MQLIMEFEQPYKARHRASSQIEIVHAIVFKHEPIRTEEVERFALQCGISGGSAGRYLRWLQEEKMIESYKQEGNKTKTWVIKK